MALTPYCENAEVRAALGVNAIELPDVVLNLTVYSIGLMRELSKLSPSLPASFLAISVKPNANRTELEQALFDATRLFSPYASARQVGVSLASMMPKDVGDGKATISRFSDAPYKETMARVEAMFQSARGSLLAAPALYAGATAPAAASFTGFLLSSRTYDPVTG